MRRLNMRTHHEMVEYNLRDGRSPIFAETQASRIEMARKLAAAQLTKEHSMIVELCCGSCDISGFFSEDHVVTGVDVVPASRDVVAERWPRVSFIFDRVERVAAFPCDLLVLCETLEHVTDPIQLVSDWGRMAQAMLISHPLYEWPAIEPGHVWSYDDADFNNWFTIAGMEVVDAYTYDMGPFPKMIIGTGRRP